MSSLRARLLLGTTLAVGVVLGVAGTALYGLVQRSLVAEVDGALFARGRLLASTVEQEGRYLDVEFDDLDMSEFATPAAGGYLQLWRGEAPIFASPSLGEATLTPWGAVGEPPFATWVELPNGARGRGVSLRFQPRQEHRGAQASTLTLVVVRDVAEIERALATLGGLLGLVGAVTLLVTALVLTAVVRRTLRPLEAISDQVAGIREDALSARLAVGDVPTELLPVVERVNALLGRLESAFARERSFSNDVAHELRTPLAGLRTTLEVTSSRPRTDADYAKALQESAEIARQLQSMVERLLQLARLDGGLRAGCEPLELADLALEAWEPFVGEAAARSLEVDWNLGDGLGVLADRELLGLVLRNLYENAVSYADEGGQLSVSALEHGEAVVVRVANSGSRLSQEQAAQATQRFWRGDAARTAAAVHCGLGLALVQRAVEALGGKVAIDSEAGGEFAVRLTLPAGTLPVPLAEPLGV